MPGAVMGIWRERDFRSKLWGTYVVLSLISVPLSHSLSSPGK